MSSTGSGSSSSLNHPQSPLLYNWSRWFRLQQHTGRYVTLSRGHEEDICDKTFQPWVS